MAGGPRKTKLRIIRQGAPVANDAWIMSQHGNLAAVFVDMKSKYCEVDAFWSGDFGPGLFIGARKDSLHLHRRQKGHTELVFTELRGWEIWCAEISRYALNICFIKP